MDEGNGFGFGVVGGKAKDDETLEVLLTVVGLVAVDDPAAPLAPPPDAASSFFFCSALSICSKAFMIISILRSSLDLALFLRELEAS